MSSLVIYENIYKNWNPPVIVTIPNEVVEAFKLKIGEKIDAITDGKKIVIKCREMNVTRKELF